jgi:hypothetical protein
MAKTQRCGQTIICVFLALVLAVDVTYLKDRHMILCISLLYRQVAIPLAWKVLLAHSKGEWHPWWLNLLAHIAPAVPPNTQVLLLFDRGLYSKRLFEAVSAYGWHPMMRIREQGLYKRPRSKTWHTLKALTKRGMQACALKVQCFKGETVEAYLWLQWDKDQAEPCLLLCDLAPKHIKGNPYPLRMWIEASFKDWKRGGFRLEQAKTADPIRLARLLFVLAVASVYLLRFGNALLQTECLQPSDSARRLSILTLGWLHSLVPSPPTLTFIQVPFSPNHLPPFYRPQKTYP